jgi:hypothetical protein
MDIIGNGSPPREPQRPAAPGLPPDPGTHLDLDAEPEPERQPARRRPFADLMSAESCAVAALALAFAALVGNDWTSYLLFDTFADLQPSPQRQLRNGAIAHAVPAALTLALGAGALLRWRPDGPAWVRGVAGGAVLLGLVLVAITLVLLQQASVAPGAFSGGSFGS